MNIDPVLLLSQLSGLLGAFIGGGASLGVAVYTHRSQDHLQRVAQEITKRETIYAEFLMEATKLLLRAYTRDEIVLGSDEQHLIGLINRMRLFAPADVVGGAEAVVKAILEISLEPGIEFRQLAVQALSKSPEPDPFLTFSLICRTDLDNVRQTMR
jgi:hypothetical protein